MNFQIGYATSGLSSHRLTDALSVLAGLGYRGVFLTLDAGHLDPYADRAAHELAIVGSLLARLQLETVVETGARFLLDPWRKHWPTLVSSENHERRIDFLLRALDMTSALSAKVMSLWSGAVEPGQDRTEAWNHLVHRLEPVLRHAERRGVMLAFEPEPGMLVETVADYRRLVSSLGHPPGLRLSLDVGHVLATGEGDPADVIRSCGPDLAAVAIEDMRRGIHEHLPFGCGELDLPAVIQALDASGFAGVVAVELARHGHEGVRQAVRSRDVLASLGVPFGRR